ncbi:hypothetical protein [Anabaena subtropica]|uniref:Uncharacterized protein n=1 Tax=Anabaena subtropica FACHB-260 TaxID=2692884 RepID=A0ABR8CWP3_9NOST|nr:hypothetical protein [Anabaena subtropica]MBD2346865.1 hypothetical protein [Anabaena subtropica FACHB-260]
MNATNTHNESICFCTAAFGKEYILLAKLLAEDIHQFAPGHVFVILTDKPIFFQNHPNVIAIKHWCRGVKPYHERRFAIQYALSLSSTVMYLDADVRICSPLPQDLNFAPGLTARSCTDMKKHLQHQFDQPSLTPERQRKKHIIESMANKVGIDIYSSSLKFINEFLFVIKADEGRELEFLRLWGELAIYADTLGLHNNPTYAMALAAVKSNFLIFHSEMNGLNFFDNRIEKIRISQGTSTLGEKSQKYFQEQSQIEDKRRNLLQKSWRFLNRKISFGYNLIRVRLMSAFLPSMLLDYPKNYTPTKKATSVSPEM